MSACYITIYHKQYLKPIQLSDKKKLENCTSSDIKYYLNLKQSSRILNIVFHYFLLLQLFKLDIQTEVMRLSEDDICCQLKRICRIADQTAPREESVGILTSLNRAEWARCRERLLQGNSTGEIFHYMIERAENRVSNMASRCKTVTHSNLSKEATTIR